MKMLIALSLMLAVLAFGNTAGAGPFGVSMGDSIKPKGGWNAKGYGEQTRKYEGSLPLDLLTLAGTREHGVCSVDASFHGAFRVVLKDLRKQLGEKYGKPSWDKYLDYDTPFSDIGISLEVVNFWDLSGNPDKIARILLGKKSLTYLLDNYSECEKAKEAGRKANTAAADQDATFQRILGDLRKAQSDCQRGAPTLGNQVGTCSRVPSAIRQWAINVTEDTMVSESLSRLTTAANALKADVTRLTVQCPLQFPHMVERCSIFVGSLDDMRRLTEELLDLLNKRTP